jgi:type I restriction enzyme S subunit
MGRAEITATGDVMTNGWQTVPLADVLKQDTNYVTELESIMYPKLSVKLYGKGAVLDAPTDGANIKMQRHQFAKSGQIILSEIWAKKGAIGIVPKEGEGALVTSHFFLFDVIETKILREFVGLLLKRNYFAEALDAHARGTTGYAAVRPKQFLSIEIPLPPLDEQHRIVERVEAITARIAMVQSLQNEIYQESELLLRSISADKSFGEPVPTPMRELVRLRTPDVIVDPNETYHFAGVYSFGRGIFRGVRRMGNQFAYPKLSRLRMNDFTYPKLMAWEGAYAIVSPECDGLVVSTEFPVFELNQEKILPETMGVYFRNPAIWETLSGQSTGTNVRRRRLNPQTFLNYEFPLPPMKQQLVLRNVQARLGSLRELQSQTREELDALLPSVLDRAFKGEL